MIGPAARKRPRWRRVVEARLATLTSRLPQALRGAPEAVHHARVASRRARETLALLAATEPQLSTNKLLRRVRRTTRVLGRVRELDVGLGLLNEITAAHPQLTGEVQAARGWLADARRQKASRLDDLGGAFREKLEGKSARLLDKLNGLDQLEWQAAIAAQVARRRRRLVRALDAAGTGDTPRRLHKLRIAVKRLRYSVELATELSGISAAPMLAVLRRVQAILGRMHDLQVLQVHLEEIDDGSRLDRTVAVIEEETRGLHRQYLQYRVRLRRTAAECERRFSRRPPGSGL